MTQFNQPHLFRVAQNGEAEGTASNASVSTERGVKGSEKELLVG